MVKARNKLSASPLFSFSTLRTASPMELFSTANGEKKHPLIFTWEKEILKESELQMLGVLAAPSLLSDIDARLGFVLVFHSE